MTKFWISARRIGPLVIAVSAGLIMGPTLAGAAELTRTGVLEGADGRGAGLGFTVCKAAWRALNNLFVVPKTIGDITGAPSVATVSMVKPCSGPVFATFTAETNTKTGASHVLDLVIEAVCLGSGGQPNPCTTGQTVRAAPGIVNFQYNALAAPQSQSVTLAFPILNRGQWRFNVKLNSSGSGEYVFFRALTVEALSP